MMFKHSIVQPMQIQDFEDDNIKTNNIDDEVIKKYEQENNNDTQENNHHHHGQHHNRKHHNGKHHSEDIDIKAASDVSEVSSPNRPINIFFRAKSETDSLIKYMPAYNDPAIESISEILFKPYHQYLKAFAYLLWAMQFTSLVALMYSLLPCPSKKVSWIVICGIPLCCLYGKEAN